MSDFISYGRQWIDSEDLRSVQRTLESDFLTQGPAVKYFEDDLTRITGARYCVAVSNGTAALHLAVAALDLSPGKEGITSPNTFAASANAFVYNGIKPRFADINPVSYNLSVEDYRRSITDDTAVVIPVHFAGKSCEMESIKDLSDRHGIKIVEDAAHAIGTYYKDGSAVGSCRYSDMTIFSFHPVKTITTGEGGAITTNDPALYQRLLELRTHGIFKPDTDDEQNPGPWYYEMRSLGFNYRLTDLQASLGSSQLKRLDGFRKRRQDIVKDYSQYFKDVDGLTTPEISDIDRTCNHLYVLKWDFEGIGKSRKDVMEHLREKGIGTQVHYIPVHTHPFYRETYGYGWGDFPAAEEYYQSALSIPLFPAMTDEQVDHVKESIREIASI